MNEAGDSYRETQRGATVEPVRAGGVTCSPPDENADLSDFTPKRAHLLLQGVYGDFPHHNDGSYLDRGVEDDSIWQHHWRRISVQLDSWYSMPSGSVGRRFMEILAAEWRGLLDMSWNSERPLIFAHVVLTNMLGVCRAKEIRARITRRMDLWDKGLHAGLVGDTESEGSAS